MNPSLALVPNPVGNSAVSVSSTANSLGVHDVMRFGTRSLGAEVAPKHPLQTRLELWDETQENLQLTIQRNIYGIHAPIRHLMERAIVQQTPVPVSFGGFAKTSNLSLDILMGKDETIEISDVLIDGVISAELGDFHTAMERKLRML